MNYTPQKKYAIIFPNCVPDTVIIKVAIAGSAQQAVLSRTVTAYFQSCIFLLFINIIIIIIISFNISEERITLAQIISILLYLK
jgi:hypothetical protein